MRHVRDPRLRAETLDNPVCREWFGKRFDECAEVVRFEPGEALIDQGREGGALFLLTRGRVSVSALLPNGKRRILRIDRAPTLLGEMELLERVPPMMTVRALEACVALMLPYALCREALLSDNAFLRRLAALLGRKERTGVERLFQAFSYPLENRLARFILETREGDLFPVRKVVAADSLGVSYRHLGQVMRDFVQRGYLTKDGPRYAIRDAEALERLALETQE